jgi:hypothetical protein
MDDLQKEPAPSEQGGVGAQRLLELIRLENNMAQRETEHGDGWLTDHAEMIRQYDAQLSALLASRPQLEAAKDMRELLAELDEIARDFDSCEYGLPIRTDISDKYVAPTNAMLTAIEASFQARLASARDQGYAERWAIDLVHLIRDSGEVSNGDAAFKVMTFVESRARELEKPLRDYAELAERKGEE